MEFLDDQLGSTTEEKLFDAYTAFIKSEIRPGEKYEDFEVNKIGKNAQVKLMTDEGALDIRRQGGCLLVDGERYYSLSDAPVLVGEGVQEDRGGPRGRRRGGRRGAGLRWRELVHRG